MDQSKVLIISNPFKGTLSSLRIGEIVKEELNKKNLDSTYIAATDGGDGFLDAFKSIYPGIFIKEVSVKYPIGKEYHNVYYLFKEETRTVFISVSDICGIKYINEADRNPMYADSYGLGEAIKDAILTFNPKRLVIGLGGSASVDLGTSVLEALGTKFYDQYDSEIKGLRNAKLKEVERIDIKSTRSLLKGVKITLLSDVFANLFTNGATDLYSITKGAKKENVCTIKENAEHFFNALGFFKDKKTYGAAGGISFMFTELLDAKIKLGSEEFLKIINFKKLIKEYDLIITGEGQFDEETLQGKLIGSIIKYKPKKLIVLCGINKMDNYPNVYSIVPTLMTKEESLNNPEESLRKLIRSIEI